MYAFLNRIGGFKKLDELMYYQKKLMINFHTLYEVSIWVSGGLDINPLLLALLERHLEHESPPLNR